MLRLSVPIASLALIAACSEPVETSDPALDTPAPAPDLADAVDAAPAPQSPVEALAPFYAQLEYASPVAPEGPDLPGPDQVLSTIAFGSCARQDRPLPVWDTIAAESPDVFLFIGDNMYADLDRGRREVDLADVGHSYVELAEADAFARFRARVPILATWDDHDYGLNDAGEELPFKRGSQHLLLQFFREPADSPRWNREGVYGSWSFGPKDDQPGRRVQIILLDTRYFRDAVDRRPGGRPPGRGPYRPTQDTSRTLLGEAQWAWLGGELKKDADVRIIASSIQVVAWEHGWESWGNFPHERHRLFELIADTGAEGVVFLSGDRHRAEISRDDPPAAPYPMWDVTSSGLNQGTQPVSEPNRFRVGPVVRATNFGMVRIDWRAQPVTLTLETRGGDGTLLTSQVIDLDTLRTDE